MSSFKEPVSPSFVVLFSAMVSLHRRALLFPKKQDARTAATFLWTSCTIPRLGNTISQRKERSAFRAGETFINRSDESTDQGLNFYSLNSSSFLSRNPAFLGCSFPQYRLDARLWREIHRFAKLVSRSAIAIDRSNLMER